MGKRTVVVTAIVIGVTAALGLVAGLTLPVAQAGTFTVTNTNPSGPGSLRQAILDANSSVGRDLIDFHPSVSGMIVLTDSLPWIDDDLSIAGPGASDLSISGDGTYPVFRIVSNKALTISRVTIRDGNASYGGGIYSDSTLLLQDTDLVNNAALNGGAVYVIGGSVKLSGGHIISNTASLYGGGVYVNAGSMTLSGADIMSNTADEHGGGVYVNSSFAVFTQTEDSTIAYNTCLDERGGGVLVYYGRAVLKGLVYGNVATGNLGTYFGGGGVYVSDSTGRLDIIGGRIISNTAGRGGGVFINQGSMSLSGGQIMSNTASHYGGGLHVQDGRVAMTDTEIMNNAAGLVGGGIYVTSVSTVSVSGGQIISNSAGSGGGIFTNLQSTLTLINTTISRNRATSGSGGGLDNDGTTALIYTTIASNTASSSGGGIFRTSGALTLLNTVVAHNSPANCDYANGGSMTSLGHNLDSGVTCGFTATTDITDTAPLLGLLTDDGVSWFHPLLDGSPAINAGLCVPGVTTVDTRGLTRPAGGLCDIGAYEWDGWLEAYVPLVLRNY